jgi:hypothetical protein
MEIKIDIKAAEIIIKECYKNKEIIFIENQIRNIEKTEISLSMVLHTLERKNKSIKEITEVWEFINENTCVELMFFDQKKEVKELVYKLIK